MLLEENGYGWGGGDGTPKAVWKYPLLNVPMMIIDMPQGAQPLATGFDAERRSSLWVLVRPAAPLVPRVVAVVATGQPLPGYVQPEWHRGVITDLDSGMVSHVFLLDEAHSLPMATQLRQMAAKAAQKQKLGDDPATEA